jgi:hypothetical protein
MTGPALAFPDSPLRELCAVVEQLGWAVTRDYRGIEQFQLRPFTAGGDTLYPLKRIVVPLGIPPAMVGPPLVHELTHALLHGNIERTPAGRTARELEARTVALVVASALNLVAPGQDLGSVLPEPYPPRVIEVIRKLLEPFRDAMKPVRIVGWYWEAWEQGGTLHVVRVSPVRQTLCGVAFEELHRPMSAELRWCKTCEPVGAGTEIVPIG